MRYLIILSCVFASFLIAPSDALGQYNTGVLTNNRASRYRGAQSTQAALLSRSTVSPYLALTDQRNGGDLASNYFTSVRPQLEAQQQSRMQQRQMQVMQSSISSMRSTAARRNQNGASATGHPTRFGSYLRYYPGFQR